MLSKSVNRWLLPAVLILFLLEIVAFPLAVGLSWADRYDSPDHVLSYKKGRLTWDSGTGIRPDGTAEIDLFDPDYDDTVNAENGDNVIAPGTQKHNFIRVKNNAPGKIYYTAVLYEINDADIPVTVEFSAEDAEDTDRYPLPRGIDEENVLRAVRGTIPKRQVANLDIAWEWIFEESDAQDIADTAFGNRIPLDDMTVGLYIVVEDYNNYIPIIPFDPDFPETEPEETEPEETEPEETEPVETEPEETEPEETEPEETEPAESEPEETEPAPDIPDEPEYILPNAPQTGDESPVTLYTVVFAFSALLAAVLIWDRIAEKKRALADGTDIPEHLDTFEETETLENNDDTKEP